MCLQANCRIPGAPPPRRWDPALLHAQGLVTQQARRPQTGQSRCGQSRSQVTGAGLPHQEPKPSTAMRYFLSLILLLVSTTVAGAVPNIVVILTDDQEDTG